MNIRNAPSGPVFNHQPVRPGPIVDQIVLFTGRTDGRTVISIENADGVQAALDGTSMYCDDPSNDTAVSESPTSNPGAARCGLFTYDPLRKPRESTIAPDASSIRQNDFGL